MLYKTTKLYPLKSYPTYQFYARADEGKYTADEIFRICILETLKWLRARYSTFGDIPEQLCTPEPEDFASFTENRLCSFSISVGLQIDVIYVAKSGIWSFRINEPDMGANPGQANERQPVFGRSFITEVSFRRHEDNVEAGMRTICTEPTDTTAECEVFRLALVKALLNHEIRFMQGGFVINGEPLMINSRAELDRAVSVINNPERSMPVVLIAETGFEKDEKSLPLSPYDIYPTLYSRALMSGLDVEKKDMSLSISADIKSSKVVIAQKKQRKKQAAKPVMPATKRDPVRLPSANIEEIAKRLVGFAMVMRVGESIIPQLQNKLHFAQEPGEVLIISHQMTVEHIPYDSYKDDLSGFPLTLYNEISQSHKRSSCFFGDVLFHSDARLKDFHNKRHQTDSLEEKCAIYSQEIQELREKITKFTQQQADMESFAESLRAMNKKNAALQKELEEKTAAFDALAKEMQEKADAYRRGAERLQFYREYIGMAEQFPTDREEVCSWAEKTFSGTITIAPRAVNELKKYSIPLDVACICDGIAYIDAYVRYRRQEINEEQLSMYSEHRHWEAGGCGKETLKMRRDDYTVSVDGRTYVLDQHIKRGVNSEELIRIYFCWDDGTKKVIIGSMPGHLPTVRNST